MAPFARSAWLSSCTMEKPITVFKNKRPKWRTWDSVEGVTEKPTEERAAIQEKKKN